MSTTGGDPDGVILELDYNNDTRVDFTTGPASFSFKPCEISYEPMIIDAGGLNQKVKVSTLRKDPPNSLEFVYKPSLNYEQNAFWVRLVQEDGSMAWTSPIFINSKKITFSGA